MHLLVKFMVSHNKSLTSVSAHGLPNKLTELTNVFLHKLNLMNFHLLNCFIGLKPLGGISRDSNDYGKV